MLRWPRRDLLRSRSAVGAWHPDGRVEEVSPGRGWFARPCVSPDGRSVVHHGGLRRAEWRIWRTELESRRTVALTPPGFGAFQPVFSWDGRWIVFVADRDVAGPGAPLRRLRHRGRPGVRTNVFLMDAEGGGLRRLTAGPYEDRRPSFSPDGGRIVFVSDREGVRDLWIAASDGRSRPRRVGLGEVQWVGSRPWFAADGRSILFHGRLPGGERVRILRWPIDGGPPRPLPNDNAGRSRGVFVDPNGEVLLVHSTRGGRWGIWELPLDGSPPRPLQPPGYREVAHATRSRTGLLTFDVFYPSWLEWASLVVRRRFLAGRAGREVERP